MASDIDKLLAACEYGDDRQPRLKKALAARNRTLVLLSIDAGPRRKELAALRLCDVDRNLCLLNIHRKGNTWQQIQLAMGRSPLDVQRQMGHTTLAMTNHYASLTTEHLRETHEKFSPLRAKDVLGDDEIGGNYWDE